MSSRIWLCTVTSRAVVGSSASTRTGLPDIAMAIITRWRSPPESSCGNAWTRRAGCAIPTRSSQASGGRSSRAASASCWPTRIVGFSDVIGSWKIDRTDSRRTRRSVAPGAPTISVPSTTIEPSTSGRAPAETQPLHGEAQRRLPGPALADERDDLAAGDVEVDAAQRVDHMLALMEAHLETADGQRRDAAVAPPLRLRLSALHLSRPSARPAQLGVVCTSSTVMPSGERM